MAGNVPLRKEENAIMELLGGFDERQRIAVLEKSMMEETDMSGREDMAALLSRLKQTSVDGGG